MQPVLFYLNGISLFFISGSSACSEGKTIVISGFTEDIRSGVCQYCLSAVLQSAYFIYPTRLSAALFVSSFSVNWIIHKLNISKLAFVVTANGCDISRYLTSQSPQDVTVVNAAGGYTGKLQSEAISI